MAKKESDKNTRPSVGNRLVRRMEDFSAALKDQNLEKFTLHKIAITLEPTQYSPSLVQETRKTLGVSQALFAKFIGVSIKTVRSWEQGRTTPLDMACRFMDEIRNDPSHWRDRLKSVMTRSTRHKGKQKV